VLNDVGWVLGENSQAVEPLTWHQRSYDSHHVAMGKESKSDPAEHSCYSNKQVCGGVGMRGTVFPHLLALVTLLEAPGAA